MGGMIRPHCEFDFNVAEPVGHDMGQASLSTFTTLLRHGNTHNPV